MVLRARWLGFRVVLMSLVALPLLACEGLNQLGLRGSLDAEAGGESDSGGADDRPMSASPDAGGVDADRAGDAPAESPDAMPTECRPLAISCSTDGRAIRTCSEQGRWTNTANCGVQQECSGGVCVCAAGSPGACDGAPIHQIAPITATVVDMAIGNQSLFLAIIGTQSSIRRIDLGNPVETPVHTGGTDVSLYALADADPTGQPIWCSEIGMAPTRTGELWYGDTRLESSRCRHVRRRDGQVYFLGEALYRRELDAGSSRELVSTQPMAKFEIAGDYLYFIGDLGSDAFLKRLSLADFTQVDTIVTRPDEGFRRLMADSSHVYLLGQGSIFRAPQAATGQLEPFWEDPGLVSWAMAQTDSHLYWSTTTPAAAESCSEAQVWRRAKSGGMAKSIFKVVGRCANELVRLGDHLYTVTWGFPPGMSPISVWRIRL